MTGQISGTTQSFGEGKALSSDLRASNPEQMAAMLQELERVSKTAEDVIVPASQLAIRVTEDDEIRASYPAPSGTPFYGSSIDLGIRRVAHEQLAEKTGVPIRFYNRLRDEHPPLAAHTVNYLLANGKENTNYMLRLVDGDLRAVLSDRYRRLDSWDVACTVLDELRNIKNDPTSGGDLNGAAPVVQRMDMSEERFYLRIMQPGFAAKITGRGEDIRKAENGIFSSGYRKDNGRWQGFDDDDPNADWVFGAFVVSDSDVGRGGLNVDGPCLMRATCTNLIVVSQALHRVHVGQKLAVGAEGLLSDHTKSLQDQAVFSEIRDMVRSTFDPELFREVVIRAQTAQAQVLEEPTKAVDAVARAYDLTDKMRQAVLDELISPSFDVNPGATVWGLSNALSAQAHKVDIESSYALEKAAGDLLVKADDLVAVRRN